MFLTLNEKLQLFHCHQASISLPKQNFESASMAGLYGIWKLRYFRTPDLFFMPLLFSQVTFNNQQPINSKIYKRFSRVNAFAICSLDLTEKITNNYLEKVLEAVKQIFDLLSLEVFYFIKKFICKKQNMKAKKYFKNFLYYTLIS